MLLLTFLSLALCAAALTAEFSRVLMTVQQNSYRPERYARYLTTSGETTSVGNLVVAALFFVCLSNYTSSAVALIVAGATALVLFVRLRLLVKTYKHPVVWTPRVKRLFSVMCLLAVGLCVGLSFAPMGNKSFTASVASLSLLCVFGSSALAFAALWLLKPVERHINNGYINDAKRILASMPDLRVIGITGSYGKTSTKHYLYRILSEEFPVCMTPGSYNTTLGVVRTVREHLKPFDRIFICEMGAKQPGDIKEICDLVHPEIGIITAVGPQHLESFKTIENVQRTKFELVDSLPENGLAVVNDDFPYIANRPVENVRAVRYGIAARPEVTYSASDIEYSASGTRFSILTPDGVLELHTRLVGECNVSNLIAAVIVALHLGVSKEKIAYAVEQIEQVEHRLSIKRTPGGITILDDAFNSNPAGSAMALDVLSSLTGGKRIVVTPGMIELGDEQERLNTEFGRKIAESADVAIIVGQYNREAILAGLEGAEIEVVVVDTFAEAQAKLAGIATPGCSVLYENDLPDTFN